MTLSRPFYWAIAVSSLLVAVISWRILVLPMDLVMPEMAAYVKQVPLAVWGHVLFGPIVLGLVPVQLSGRIRSRNPRLHRSSGRIYAGAVVIAAVAALGLVPGSVASPLARLGFVVLAILWIGFTALGIAAARRRDFAAHRRWMVRSLALTFAAVTLRVIMAPLMASGWTVAETYDVTAWSSWLINLAVVEYAMRHRLRLA